MSKINITQTQYNSLMELYKGAQFQIEELSKENEDLKKEKRNLRKDAIRWELEFKSLTEETKKKLQRLFDRYLMFDMLKLISCLDGNLNDHIGDFFVQKSSSRFFKDNFFNTTERQERQDELNALIDELKEDGSISKADIVVDTITENFDPTINCYKFNLENINSVNQYFKKHDKNIKKLIELIDKKIENDKKRENSKKTETEIQTSNLNTPVQTKAKQKDWSGIDTIFLFTGTILLLTFFYSFFSVLCDFLFNS